MYYYYHTFDSTKCGSLYAQANAQNERLNISGVAGVLYFLKILSGSRNFLMFTCNANRPQKFLRHTVFYNFVPHVSHIALQSMHCDVSTSKFKSPAGPKGQNLRNKAAWMQTLVLYWKYKETWASACRLIGSSLRKSRPFLRDILTVKSVVI